MNFSIHEVDQVIERTQCTYEEAKSALLESDGDVLDAVIILENRKKSASSTFKGFSDFFNTQERTPDTIADKIKELIEEGSASKFIVRDNYDRQVIAVPLTTGAAVGTIALMVGAAPMVVITSLITKFGLNYRFVIVKSDGSEVVL